MPEEFQHKTAFSLLEVTESIRKTLAGRYSRSYWVKAEMNKLNYYTYSGHCYPDLVEKTDGVIKAQLRGLIWKQDYEAINRKFLEVLNAPLTEGSKILFLAQIQFDAVYGLSLRILDIDPAYSLGELEREKRENIRRLQQEGYFNLNKAVPLALLPQRIAVLSVETSKGYADFIRVMDENPKGYAFTYQLFPVKLQGADAVKTLIRQLAYLEKRKTDFDIVVIVRGGGAEAGLTAFNDYALSLAVARFPLPVFTGIGHATNETIVEMVAFKNAITPTQIAYELLERFAGFERELARLSRALHKAVLYRLDREKMQLNRLQNDIPSGARTQFRQIEYLLYNAALRLQHGHRNLLNRHRQTLLDLSGALQRTIEQSLKTQRTQLDNFEQQIRLLHPENVLKRGFSITYFQGKVVTDSQLLEAGQEVETVLAKGRFRSTVNGSEF